MNRNFKITVFAVVLCVLSVLLVSCGNDDGDTSGNAQNGVVSDDVSGGGVVSDVISTGENVVSNVGDAVSDAVSDIFSDDVETSYVTEDTSFISEGEVSNI